jgi:hypothetical protein
MTNSPIRPQVTYTAPEFRDGASTPVYRDGKYCGTVTREAHPEGGSTFKITGPYANLVERGYRSLRDAAEQLAAHDDFGFLILR